MKKTYVLVVLGITLWSCVAEDYFGASQYGNIKQILVSNQSGNASISLDSLTVTVEIPGGVDLTAISIENLVISPFAQANKKQGDILNLENDEIIEVKAEDGSIYEWKIRAFVASKTPQLDNGELDLWYLTPGNYYEPGTDAATTIWGTSNPGSQILNKLATIPEDLGNGNIAAKMVTLDNGFLAGTFGAPISAGSIYTGFFNSDNIDISNPQAAIEFGTPFSGRPTKIRFKYSYVPGSENKNQDGDILNFGDACDVYALLEIRQNGEIQRLGTAWFRSDVKQVELITQEVVFTYGTLDDSFPDYMYPPNNNYVSDELAEFALPTHITFVASSSFDGANFSGAIDSSLIIDAIEMIYE